MKLLRSDAQRAAFVDAVMNAPLPILVAVRKARKQTLTDAIRARIHIVIRDIANFTGHSETGLKELLKANEVAECDWPGSWEDGPLGKAWKPVHTMQLNREDADRVLHQLEALAAFLGVPLTPPETWTDSEPTKEREAA